MIHAATLVEGDGYAVDDIVGGEVCSGNGDEDSAMRRVGVCCTGAHEEGVLTGGNNKKKILWPLYKLPGMRTGPFGTKLLSNLNVRNNRPRHRHGFPNSKNGTSDSSGLHCDRRDLVSAAP